jgi:carbamoyl-phosphate synthase small subunit
MSESYAVCLTLEDGTQWWGRSSRPITPREGEVVFTTSQGGYPQSISDPSYCGQILIFAFPLVNVYGVDTENLESSRPWTTGVLTQHIRRSPLPETLQLEEWLREWNIPLGEDMDCRGLILHLRSRGTLWGRLDSQAVPPQEVPFSDHVARVSSRKILRQGEGSLRIGILDCGMKEGIARSLRVRGCEVVRFPSDTSAEAILAEDLRGLILSNGPGDPSVLSQEIATVRQLVGQLPLFGICLGTQILSLACGGKTFKLPYGHRGANQPVQDITTGRGYVTSQNHGYAIEEESLKGTELDVWFRHLGDGTVEGIRHRKFPALGVQFHPEACPGPRDANHLFDTFLKTTATWKEGEHA